MCASLFNLLVFLLVGVLLLRGAVRLHLIVLTIHVFHIISQSPLLVAVRPSQRRAFGGTSVVVVSGVGNV